MATVLSADEIKRVKGLGFLHNKGTDAFSARILTVNGKVTPKQLACVAEAAALYATGDVTFTSRQTMEVQGVPFDKIEVFRAHLAQAGLETGGTGPRVRPIVCCKGSTCLYGRIDTFALAEKIHQRFYTGYHDVSLPHKFKIAVGGCPNNCVKPDLNDLGVIGQRVQAYDSAVSQIGYKVVLGGFWGKRGRRGLDVPMIFTSEDETLDVIEKAILLYRECGKSGERFGMMIERLGFEEVVRHLLSDAILERKSTILGA